MSYQVLARKWRPPDFTSLVGQDHVVTALRNALADSRIAQAYLFSGIRGVGKTTAARVLAKALNCLNGPDGGPAPDPCNECDSCREINSGGTLDVIEVDAATYSKVEQVRELTETLRYGPARGRYKVVVLDEVHRLSRQAFDALLKIVEEPPAHLVFIFATTEIDSVPATILSRCQEFQFRRVPSQIVAAHLRRICDVEKIEASDAALRLISRAGEGSVRDAVALLDQMSTFGHGQISDDDAAQLLAGFDAALFGRLLEGILEGDAPAVSAVAREVEANGWDPHHVFGQFLGFCRDALHLAMGGDPDSVDLPEEEAKTLAGLVSRRPGGYQGLLQILHLLLGSEATVRRSEFGSVALEIAWLRAAELPRVQAIEALLSGSEAGGGGSGPGRSSTGTGGGAAGGSGGPHGGPAGRRGGSHTSGSRSSSRGATSRRAQPAVSPATPATPATEPKTPAPEARPPETRRPAPKEPALRSTDSDTAPSDASPPSSAETPTLLDAARIGSVLELLPTSLAGLLRGADLGVRDGHMVVAPKSDDRLVEAALSRKRNADALEDALRNVYGPGIPWTIEAAAADLELYIEDRPAEAEAPDRPPVEAYEPAPATSPDSGPPETVPERPPRSEPEQFEISAAPSEPGESRHDRRRRRTPSGHDHGRNNGQAHGDLDAATLELVKDLPTVRRVQELFRGKIRSVRDEIEDMGAQN